MIVVSILAFSKWGPTGAAAGVLVSTAMMSVLMHVLLRRVTHLPWLQMFRPLVPGLFCSAGVAATVLGVEYALKAAMTTPNVWLLVACQAPAAALFVIVFALFAPNQALRAIVLEMAGTVVPKSIQRHRWARAYMASHMPAIGEAGQ